MTRAMWKIVGGGTRGQQVEQGWVEGDVGKGFRLEMVGRIVPVLVEAV